MASLSKQVTPSDDGVVQGETTSSSLLVESKLIIDQWKNQEDGALVLQSLQYLDVVTLIQKKHVCNGWKQLCIKSIDYKCGNNNNDNFNEDQKTKKKKVFQSNQELKEAVKRYSPGEWADDDRRCSPVNAEEMASIYGWPINKWDVSNITDFSNVFSGRAQFNEPIGSWDVSNARTTELMFERNYSFNQDISSWNVSNVTNIVGMFYLARRFNHDISSWNVSKVTTMEGMFCHATDFNQDVSSWNVSNVTDMRLMFNMADRFNQPIGMCRR